MSSTTTTSIPQVTMITEAGDRVQYPVVCRAAKLVALAVIKNVVTLRGAMSSGSDWYTDGMRKVLRDWALVRAYLTEGHGVDMKRDPDFTDWDEKTADDMRSALFLYERNIGRPTSSGYVLTPEMRQLAHRLVDSDGWVTVSLFIEPGLQSADPSYYQDPYAGILPVRFEGPPNFLTALPRKLVAQAPEHVVSPPRKRVKLTVTPRQEEIEDSDEEDSDFEPQEDEVESEDDSEDEDEDEDDGDDQVDELEDDDEDEENAPGPSTQVSPRSRNLRPTARASAGPSSPQVRSTAPPVASGSKPRRPVERSPVKSAKAQGKQRPLILSTSGIDVVRVTFLGTCRRTVFLADFIFVYFLGV